ncbi:MAG TPA: CmpA/NrtA family ABC transporter substrate-binding protein [Verrucomicrobiae bacterium]|jgi:ABC-type nitrate/sulfonate/bicarbonate transport system substrate-binding protein|nr:CmpA/NrtA family ABC transporter substrate-binding protein [Verrucomicrobiae bacterium]
MRFAKTKIRARHKSASWLNVGFAATIDCAILIAAQELGLFRKFGLTVRLRREVGWATIREKLLHEELDAAAAHASMLFSIYCGIGTVRRACLTGLLLGFNGSAITLSKELWDLGVRDATTLAEVIRKLKGKRTFTFGVVLELSSQNLNLRKWLCAGGLDPDRDVRTVVVPSALVHDTFRAGHLDGYCVAEPWNSAAAMDGSGWIVAATSEIEPDHPEKVLLVLQDFAERREEEHLRMIAALIEASRFCDKVENRPELARMLSQPQYFDLDRALLTNALVGPFESGRGRRNIKDFVIYDSSQVGAPTRAKGKWVFDLVQKIGGNGSNPALRSEIIGKVFREDIFRKAARLVGNGSHKNHASDRVSPFFLPESPLVPAAPRMETPETIFPAAVVPLNAGSQTASVSFCS